MAKKRVLRHKLSILGQYIFALGYHIYIKAGRKFIDMTQNIDIIHLLRMKHWQMQKKLVRDP